MDGEIGAGGELFIPLRTVQDDHEVKTESRDEMLEGLSENKQVRMSVLATFLSLAVGGIHGAT